MVYDPSPSAPVLLVAIVQQQETVKHKFAAIDTLVSLRSEVLPAFRSPGSHRIPFRALSRCPGLFRKIKAKGRNMLML